MAPGSRDSGGPTDWPEPAAELVPESLQHRPPGCLTHLLRAVCPGHDQPAQPAGVLHMTAPSFAELGSGWSPVRTLGDGTDYRWVTGREASLEVRRDAATDATLAIRLRPPPELANRQVMRLLVDGHEVATTPLVRGYQTITAVTPAAAWRSGHNLLVLQFLGAIPDTDPEAPWQGPLPRAAAVDWVEVRPTAERRSR